MEFTLVYKIYPIVRTTGSPVLNVLRVVLILLLHASLPINEVPILIYIFLGIYHS